MVAAAKTAEFFGSPKPALSELVLKLAEGG